MLFAEDLARAAWRCIHFARTAELTEDLRRELTQQGVVVFELRAAGIRGKNDLMSALADALHLPDHFGRNWDAVLECLRDLPDRIPGEGYALFIHDGSRLWHGATDLAGALVETWLAAAEDAAHDDVGLHLVFLDSAKTGVPKG